MSQNVATLLDSSFNLNHRPLIKLLLNYKTNQTTNCNHAGNPKTNYFISAEEKPLNTCRQFRQS